MYDVVNFDYLNYDVENEFIVIVEMSTFDFDVLSFHLSEMFSYDF